jgi:hypothetical protein
MTQDEENLRLVATLRQMDQLIFRMSQCPNWEQMRPIFQELLYGTMFRMNAESDRIRMLMVPEIRRVYAQPQEETASADGHPRLEGPGDASDLAPLGQLEKPNGDDNSVASRSTGDDEGTVS